MLVDEIEGREVTDAFIELGGVLEIAEQESQAQDLEALADGERVGPVDIAEGLIGEETRCGENRTCVASGGRPAPGSPPIPPATRDRRCGCPTRGAAARGARRAVSTGIWILLKITDRFWRSLVSSPLTSRNWAACVTGSNTINVPCGTCRERMALSPAGRSTISSVTSSSSFSRSSGRSIAETPEDLAIIFGRGQIVGIMRRDLPHARAHRKGHLDQIIERRLIARGAESTVSIACDPGSSGFCWRKEPRRSSGTSRSMSSRTGRASPHSGALR